MQVFGQDPWTDADRKFEDPHITDNGFRTVMRPNLFVDFGCYINRLLTSIFIYLIPFLIICFFTYLPS